MPLRRCGVDVRVHRLLHLSGPQCIGIDAAGDPLSEGLVRGAEELDVAVLSGGEFRIERSSRGLCLTDDVGDGRRGKATVRD